MEKVIIYLIIGVGYAIFNWYRKLNVPKENDTPQQPKQRQPRRETSSSPQQEKSIEDILRELTESEEETAKRTTPTTSSREEYIDTPPPKYESVEKGYEDIENKGRIERQEELLKKAAKAEKRKQKKSEYEIGQISDFRYDEEVKKKKKIQFNLREAVKQKVILERPKHFE